MWWGTLPPPQPCNYVHRTLCGGDTPPPSLVTMCTGHYVVGTPPPPCNYVLRTLCGGDTPPPPSLVTMCSGHYVVGDTPPSLVTMRSGHYVVGTPPPQPCSCVLRTLCGGDSLASPAPSSPASVVWLAVKFRIIWLEPFFSHD